LSLNVLAFDTVTSSCAITIWKNHQILAEKQQFINRGHAEVLVPLIESALDAAKLSYQELDLLAVTTGPGAFTGIRIGLATARSLALVCKLPLIGITNFTALVHAIPKSERAGCKVLVVLETKRSDFYICLYDEDLSVLVEPKTIDGAGLGCLVQKGILLLAGDAIERALPFLQGPGLLVVKSAIKTYVDPAVVAELAVAIMGYGVALDKPLPFYLKPPDVNLPNTSGVAGGFNKQKKFND
jgi:tRNA threonylcarbamoyladenosine biosynthesis protein TsaB